MLAIEQGRQITPEDQLRFIASGPAYDGCMRNVVAVFGRVRARVVGIEIAETFEVSFPQSHVHSLHCGIEHSAAV